MILYDNLQKAVRHAVHIQNNKINNILLAHSEFRINTIFEIPFGKAPKLLAFFSAAAPSKSKI